MMESSNFRISLILTLLLFCTACVGSKTEPSRMALPSSLEPYREVIESNRRPRIDIFLDGTNDPGPFRSKVRGKACVPVKDGWPESSGGEPLQFLCQINFSELPGNDSLPSEGLIQFFIAEDDLYGCNLERLDDTSGFAVRHYRRPPNGPFCEEPPPPRQEFPYSGPPRTMRFERSVALLPGSNYLFENPEFEAIRESDELSDEYFDLTDWGHHLLGHASFTQSDPRSYHEDLRDWVTLLQFDSDWDNGNGFMWGDSGVGHFFIRKADLERGDFSHIYYHWDCY